MCILTVPIWAFRGWAWWIDVQDYPCVDPNTFFSHLQVFTFAKIGKCNITMSICNFGKNLFIFSNPLCFFWWYSSIPAILSLKIFSHSTLSIFFLSLKAKHKECLSLRGNLVGLVEIGWPLLLLGLENPIFSPQLRFRSSHVQWEHLKETYGHTD